MREIHPMHDTSKDIAGYFEMWYAGCENPWHVPGIKTDREIIRDSLVKSNDIGINLGQRVIYGFDFMEWYFVGQNYYIGQGAIISQGTRKNFLSKNIADAIPSDIVSILGKTQEMVIDAAEICGLPTKDIKLIS